MVEEEDPAARPHHRLVSVVAVLCTVISILNVAGWLTGSTVLRSIAPGLPSMVPVTAALSIFTAGGMLLCASKGTSCAAMLAPVVTALLCILIEFCYIRGFAPAPFILAKSGAEQVTSLSSAMTAGMFLALNVAILLSVYTVHVKAAQVTAAAVLMLAVLNLSGYLFHDTVILRFLPTQGTSIITSTVLGLLGFGTLFLKPRQGLMAAFTGDLPGAVMTRRLLIPTVLVPIASGLLASAGEQAGLYEAHAVLPLFVLFLVVLFLMVIWRFALQLSATDRARARVQRDLREAVDELRREHERKDVFMATLAHELRNPLAPISAAAEILKHGGAGAMAERQRIGNTIANQITNLVTIVNDLLDVERLRTRRIRLDRTLLDVRSVISEALDQTRPMMTRCGHACVCNTPDAPVMVRGDRTRLVQILSNLLINAAKYTPEGGRISVSLSTRGGFAEIVVEDNGAGMTREFLERLFEPYVQAQVSPEGRNGGLGLGLALAKQLAALHEGHLSAHSAGPGKGSRFVLGLPLARQAGGMASGPVPPPASTAAARDDKSTADQNLYCRWANIERPRGSP